MQPGIYYLRTAVRDYPFDRVPEFCGGVSAGMSDSTDSTYSAVLMDSRACRAAACSASPLVLPFPLPIASPLTCAST